MADKPKVKENENIQQAPGTPGEATGTGAAAAQSQSPQQRAQVKLDDSKAIACYANFCRVTGTPVASPGVPGACAIQGWQSLRLILRLGT